MSELTPETPPPAKLIINDANPLRTSDLRDRPIFRTADPLDEVPDVVLASGILNPMDRQRPTATRVSINDTKGESIGALNVIQTRGETWLNDVSIKPEKRGERFGVATYLGVITLAHELGRPVRSDPAGLSEDSTRVWRSLVKRGVAEAVSDTQDQHGNPRFISKPTETNSGTKADEVIAPKAKSGLKRAAEVEKAIDPNHTLPEN